MTRRLLSAFFIVCALLSLTNMPTMAAGLQIAESAQTESVSSKNFGSSNWVAPGASEATEFFRSGVTFDPAKHQWVDRYNKKPVNLGLPGVTERFGANSVISAVTGGSTTSTPVKDAGTFPWKKVIIGTCIGAAIATSIAVPIACGVHARHHRNHIRSNAQANQAAAYYYFHNQTLPIPVVPQPVPVYIPRHGKPPVPPP